MRSQFFMSTDAQDQYKTPLTNMIDTMKSLGQKLPRYAHVDNPVGSTWLFDLIPSLQVQQTTLDDLSNNNGDDLSNDNRDTGSNNDINDNERPSLTNFDLWFSANVAKLNQSDAMNTNACAIMEVLLLDSNDKIVVGLDCEWNMPTVGGRVIGPPRKLALTQICCQSDNKMHVVVYQAHRLKHLPPNLCKLLHHERIQFTGCQIGGDVAKINRDFNLNIEPKNKCIDLVHMTLSRAMSIGGRSLDSIAKAVLGMPVDKGLQNSNWESTSLSENALKYAAKDVLISLELCFELSRYPDLTTLPTPDQIIGGLAVDIAPYLGSTTIFNKGCSAGYGIVVEDTQK